jgi:uncharacterized membrane protein SpoIIM required for sporulation
VNLDAFLARRRTRWSELEQLVRQAGRRPERLGPDGVRRLGTLYRATTADLALARRKFTGDPVVAYLTDLVGRARHLVYDSERRRGSLREFALTGYWRRVRERPGLLGVAALCLFGTWVLAGVWAWRDPGAALAVAPDDFRSWTEPIPDRPAPSTDDSIAFASMLFTNNIRVALLAFAAGIAAGLGSAFVLLYNGLVLGVVTGLAVNAGNGPVLLEWIPAHGLLELSCIVVAGAAGMRMGWALVDPGRRRRSVALAAEARPAVEIVLGTAVWLVLAGILEGFVSPSGIGLPARVVVGVLAAGAFWGLVIWRGRPAPAPVDTVDGTDAADTGDYNRALAFARR